MGLPIPNVMLNIVPADPQVGITAWLYGLMPETMSIGVNLLPGSNYEIQLTLSGAGTSKNLNVATWSENFPISQTIELVESSNQTYSINQSGTSSGYILYTHASGKGAAIDVNNSSSACLEVANNVSYVIIRGLTLKGASKYGILFKGAANDVIIENNDISAWGTGSDKVGAIEGGSNLERIIIQRNKIHDPRGTAFSWDNGHPVGPLGIQFQDSKGNHVIRYNDFYSSNWKTGSDEHYFHDVMAGGQNDGPDGFPGKNSDIYGNYVSRCWDNAIQAEGGGKNVRIWGNLIEHVNNHIAIAPVSNGPIYIWKNIFGENWARHLASESDNWQRSAAFKSGGDTQWNKGRVYILHNTSLNPLPIQPGQQDLLGPGGGIKSSGGKTYEHKVWNNILTEHKEGKVFKDESGSCTNDLDYNLYAGFYADNPPGGSGPCPHEKNGIELTSSKWYEYLDPNNAGFDFDEVSGTSNTQGEFALKPGSPGIDAGKIIPNFNDGYAGSGPDIGVMEVGAPAMEFGVNAYLNGNSAVKMFPANGLAGKSAIKVSPNPFNTQTRLYFQGLKNPVVNIFNVDGQLVKSLGTIKQHNLLWEARQHTPGIYFVTAKQDRKIITQKVLLLK